MRFISAAYAVILIIVIFFSGCSSYDAAESEVIFAMDTVMELTAYGENGRAALTGAIEEINRLDRLLSVTDPGSDVSKINNSRGAAVDVSSDAAQLVDAAVGLSERTNGALDISVYPIVKAWGFTSDSYRVPPDEELKRLLGFVGYSRISVDTRANTVSLDPEMEIDLGSMGKGYAGDRATEKMKETGVTSALLNLGGDILALGTKPDGSLWRIAVRDPLDSGKYLGIISADNKAVATSGGYERYFEQDGKVYRHIIDPATGYPADSGVISVTVIGENGAVCDGLSTSLFVMGLESAAEYWKSCGEFDAIIVTDNGEVHITQGIESSFELLSTENYSLNVIR